MAAQTETTAQYSEFPSAPDCLASLGSLNTTPTNGLTAARMENGLSDWLPNHVPTQSCSRKQLNDDAFEHACVAIETS